MFLCNGKLIQHLINDPNVKNIRNYRNLFFKSNILVQNYFSTFFPNKNSSMKFSIFSNIFTSSFVISSVRKVFEKYFDIFSLSWHNYFSATYSRKFVIFLVRLKIKLFFQIFNLVNFFTEKNFLYFVRIFCKLFMNSF